jgi:hypothetical protein
MAWPYIELGFGKHLRSALEAKISSNDLRRALRVITTFCQPGSERAEIRILNVKKIDGAFTGFNRSPTFISRANISSHEALEVPNEHFKDEAGAGIDGEYAVSHECGTRHEKYESHDAIRGDWLSASRSRRQRVSVDFRKCEVGS